MIWIKNVDRKRLIYSAKILWLNVTSRENPKIYDFFTVKHNQIFMIPLLRNLIGSSLFNIPPNILPCSRLTIKGVPSPPLLLVKENYIQGVLQTLESRGLPLIFLLLCCLVQDSYQDYHIALLKKTPPRGFSRGFKSSRASLPCVFRLQPTEVEIKHL